MGVTPLTEIKRRIGLLQSAMARQGLQGVLIVERVDLYYFSGTGQEAHLFVPVEGEPALLVRKSLERAMEDSPLSAILPVKNLAELKQEVLDRAGSGVAALGMELDVLPVNLWRQYVKLFSESSIEDASPLIKDIRAVKSSYELEFMAQAAELNDEMFATIPELLREGISEVEFAGMLEGFYRKRGHPGLIRVRSFNQEVFYGHIMSGTNLAVPSCSVGPTGGPGLHPLLPHGASTKVIGRNEPVQIDYVAVVGGYIVDQARTFFLGEPPEPFKRVHAVALQIQSALMEMGRPGVRAESLYDAAVNIAVDAGFLEGFMGYPQPVPFVGHGVGLELDEYPIVGRKSGHILREGMVIALEPKFIIPGKGLAGIENTFVVTGNGLEKITRFSDEIQVLP